MNGKEGSVIDASAYPRRADMGNTPCSGFCLCVNLLPCCYAKDDALMDDDSNQGAENNKKQSSKWCVDDSATERVFIPDGKSAYACCQTLCSVWAVSLVCFKRDVARQQVEQER